MYSDGTTTLSRKIWKRIPVLLKHYFNNLIQYIQPIWTRGTKKHKVMSAMKWAFMWHRLGRFTHSQHVSYFFLSRTRSSTVLFGIRSYLVNKPIKSKRRAIKKYNPSYPLNYTIILFNSTYIRKLTDLFSLHVL